MTVIHQSRRINARSRRYLGNTIKTCPTQGGSCVHVLEQQKKRKMTRVTLHVTVENLNDLKKIS
jgi:hypothetical protein